MNKFYIFWQGVVASAGFDTLQEAETFAKEGGFHNAFIIQIVSHIE